MNVQSKEELLEALASARLKLKEINKQKIEQETEIGFLKLQLDRLDCKIYI